MATQARLRQRETVFLAGVGKRPLAERLGVGIPDVIDVIGLVCVHLILFFRLFVRYSVSF